MMIDEENGRASAALAQSEWRQDVGEGNAKALDPGRRTPHSSAQDLVASFRDTVSFSVSPKLREATEHAAGSSKVYYELFRAQKKTPGYSARLFVEETTTFSAAKAHLRPGKTAVLNFANPVTPGGGVTNGAMAQEECLCRSSNLYTCLSADTLLDFYQFHQNLNHQFYSDRIIYTKGVTVFKDDSELPRKMPESDWFQVDVITCAAPYIANRKYTNSAALKALFKYRIRNIFEAALENGITVLILGAFGCGAFKNPPDVVAAAFKEVIDENSYRDYLDEIVFAIKKSNPGTPAIPCPNLTAFQRAFRGAPSADALRFPYDHWEIMQSIGVIKMPSGRELLGGSQFNPFLEWQKGNKYYGKQFSILGDSISTLDGYNPDGYNLYYKGAACEKSGVHEMRDTWWGKVLDYFGGKLLVNNSWSGSRVTKYPDWEVLFPAGCSEERTNGLHIGSVLPDVIIVYLGSNDWGYGVPVDSPSGMADNHFTVFAPVYREMIERLKKNYPAAEIFCCTLSETFMASVPLFRFPASTGGIHIEKYNEVIRRTAKQCGCKLIELYRNHIPYDAVDGSHPTADGMNTLAVLMIRGICGEAQAPFLDCAGAHAFTIAEDGAAGTKLVCRKCGLVKYDRGGKAITRDLSGCERPKNNVQEPPAAGGRLSHLFRRNTKGKL